MITYQVVSSEKSALVASGELPEQADGNKSREQPDNHDNGSDVLKLGGTIGARKHEESSASSIGNAVSSGQKRVLGETLDDELVEVGNSTVDDLVEKNVEEEEPDLAVHENLLDLRSLDLSVKDTTAALGVLSNEHGTLLDAESLGGKDVVGHEEVEENTPTDGHATAEDVDDAPDGPSLGLTDSVEENAAEHASETVEAVEETGASGLGLAAEPLGDDEHKGGGDDGLKGTEEESTDCEPGKVGAGGGAEKDGSPGENKGADNLSGRESLGEV
jgi:phosphoribosyl-ATP pyrophosphohydrolase